jgi:phosphatidylserine decarboxylase
MRIPLGSSYFLDIHKEGERFVLIFGGVTFVLFFVNPVLCTIGCFLTMCCMAFFRDPDRITPKTKDVVISPADGKITKISIIEAPTELKQLEGMEMLKISVFLSVFDVHVNRVPIGGTILETNYVPGKFISAALDKSSTENERNSIVIKTEAGHKVGFVQIAGLIARRIVSEAREGMEYSTGERYGIIRFGSRMDIYLPVEYSCLVSEGQIMIGGETVLAKIV